MLKAVVDFLIPPNDHEWYIEVHKETPREHATSRYHHKRATELGQAAWRLGPTATIAEIYEEAGYQ